MLSIHPQTSHESFSFPLRHLDLASLSSPSTSFHPAHSGMGGGYPPKNLAASQQAPPPQTAEDVAVAQALEIARESPDGAQDPTVNGILEAALARIWSKVQARPDSYIMTRDEFAVFNFYQHRFIGNKVAVAARKRYWDNSTGAA